MQTVWRGKGDNKLIRKLTGGGSAAAATGTVGEDCDIARGTLLRYGPMCTEEKFTVLPYDVRLSIARTVDEWVKRSPANRLCVADCMVGSLTLMAHGTHQLYLSFEKFLNCKFDDDKLLRVLRCYKNCVPEPGTYLGEIVAQFFQHCKQQSNLNVKRTTCTAPPVASTSTKRRKTASLNEKEVGEKKEEEEEEEEEQDGDDYTTEEVVTNVDYDDQLREKCKKSDIDRKFDVIMSLKKVATVVLMFRCTQARRFLFDDNNAAADETHLKAYLKTKLFATVSFVDHRRSCKNRRPSSDVVPHEFDIKQFENKPGTEVYFSLTVYRKRKHDAILDDLFISVRKYNQRIRDRTAPHRLGICDLVYCSDTLYFMEISQTLFIENSITFLYCFLTDKYRPVIETKDDSFVFGLVKILSSIEYFTKCSLKRNHNSKMGHGPLTSVISEGGLNESAKYTKAMFRKSMLNDKETPPPPAQPLTHECSDDDDDDTENEKRKFYVINEPYINTFLNRPVECGSMY